MFSLITSHNHIQQKASALSASFFVCISIKYDLKLIKIRKIKYDINKIEVKIKKINKKQKYMRKMNLQIKTIWRII